MTLFWIWLASAFISSLIDFLIIGRLEIELVLMNLLLGPIGLFYAAVDLISAFIAARREP